MHAACHALLNVLPLLLICNPADVGTGALRPAAACRWARVLRCRPGCTRGLSGASRLPRASQATSATAHRGHPPRCTLPSLTMPTAECDSPYDTRFKPERILLFDKHPGGIGIAAAVSASVCARTRGTAGGWQNMRAGLGWAGPAAWRRLGAQLPPSALA